MDTYYQLNAILAEANQGEFGQAQAAWQQNNARGQAYWASTDTTAGGLGTYWSDIGTASASNYPMIFSQQTQTTAGGTATSWYWNQEATAAAGQWTITGTASEFMFHQDPAQAKRQLLQAALRAKLAPAVRRRAVLPSAYDVREQTARQALRDMLSEADWRRYCTNAFLMVKGKSGYWYQLFADHRVLVYRMGNKVASICIHSHQSVPPTDHVINLKLLVEFDEQQVWAGGNVSQYQLRAA